MTEDEKLDDLVARLRDDRWSVHSNVGRDECADAICAIRAYLSVSRDELEHLREVVRALRTLLSDASYIRELHSANERDKESARRALELNAEGRS